MLQVPTRVAVAIKQVPVKLACGIRAKESLYLISLLWL